MRKEKSDFGPYFITSFILASIVFSIYLFLSASDLYKANQAKQWPTAQGIIQTANVTDHHVSRGCSFDFNFKYNYKIKLAIYSGDNYIFGGIGCEREEADRIVNSNPVGAEIAVHYDPENPENSVIVAGRVSPVTWKLAILILVSFIGEIIFIIWWSRGESNS